MLEQDIYSAIGEPGFERLVSVFYAQIPADPILGPMYPAHDLTGAEHRLRDFLVGRFGGPMRYIEQRGHPRLRMRHAPFHINIAAKERWLEIMGRALDQSELDPEATAVLRSFFESTADFLINRPD